MRNNQKARSLSQIFFNVCCFVLFLCRIDGIKENMDGIIAAARVAIVFDCKRKEK